MTTFSIIWFIVAIWGGAIPWGFNIPTHKRTHAVAWLAGAVIAFGVLTQSYLLKLDVSTFASAETKQAATQVSEKFGRYLQATTYKPGQLGQTPIAGWYRVISSALLHYGWLHLAINVWFLVLFGHVLEHALAWKRFLIIVALGAIIPGVAEGLLGRPNPLSLGWAGGLAGILYAVMGAMLIMLPRARVFVAVNYDLRFWAAIFCILLPVTYVANLASLALAEMVLLMGFTAAFLLIQPENYRLKLPVAWIVIFKFLADFFLVKPTVGDVLDVTLWRFLVGILVGGFAGFFFYGRQSWNSRWDDDKPARPDKEGAAARGKMRSAQLEAAGHKTEEGARAYLGQRVFVGDATKAIAFYRDVVLEKFPNLMLPLQDQVSLARLLHFKGHDKEALRAYETLIHNATDLPDEYWAAWLKAAELALRLEPDNPGKACQYLDRFEQGSNLMLRDKIEAQRLRAELPATAEAREKLTATAQPPAAPVPELPTGTDTVPAEDFKRIAPKTFRYIPDGPPVSLRVEKIQIAAPSLADKDHLNKFWKPLPSMAEKISDSIALLDKRVKSNRYVEEANAPSYYAGGKGDRVAPSPRTRLGRLELVNAALPETTPVEDMPGEYGGLQDHGETTDYFAIRLRGEPTGALRARTRKPRHVETSDPRQHHAPIQSDIASLVEANPDETYAVTPAADTEASTSKSAGFSRIMLSDDQTIPQLEELLAGKPELFAEYAAAESDSASASASHVFPLRRIPADKIPPIAEALATAGIPATVLEETDPVLHADPIEVVSIQVDSKGFTLRTAFGNRRVGWDEPRLGKLSRVRLTSSSVSPHRLILEVFVPFPSAARYQLHERTLSLKACKIDGATPPDVESFFTGICQVLAARCTHCGFQPHGGEMPACGNLPRYDSYRYYNDAVLREMITARSTQ